MLQTKRCGKATPHRSAEPAGMHRSAFPSSPQVVFAQPPMLVYPTSIGPAFDPALDKREVLLTGFQGVNHDHSLHSVTMGPDGKWVFNAGNTGAMFTDRSGKTFRVFSAYRPGVVGPFKFPHDPAAYAGKPSDDGHVYIGGFTVRMNPDGTNAEIIGQTTAKLRTIDDLAGRNFQTTKQTRHAA